MDLPPAQFTSLPATTLRLLQASAVKRLPLSTLLALPQAALESLPIDPILHLTASTIERSPASTVHCLRRAYDKLKLDADGNHLIKAHTKLRPASAVLLRRAERAE